MPTFAPSEKQLGQVAKPGAATATLLYGPATNVTAIGRMLTISNVHASSSAKYRVYYDNGESGAPHDQAEAILYDVELLAGETENLDLFLPASSIDEIYVEADTANTLTFTLHGGENLSTDSYTEIVEKFLGKARPADTTATSIYSPDVSIDSCDVKMIVACNVTGTDATYRIFIDDDGTTYDDTTALFYDITLPGNSSEILRGCWGMNDATGNLAVRTGTANAINFSAYGIEYNPAT